MGHEYVKENDVFSTDQNGVVPKPTASDIENNHVLKADHTWGEGGGSGEVIDVKVNGDSVLDENNEAQITSYKEVTMSEYNALPQSKETDGVLYCIKDVGGADGFPPLIYSDEEREIGVWRDGRPLYQKTIDCGYLPNNDVSLVQTGLTNIVAVQGFGYCLSSFQNIFIPNTSAAGVQWCIGIYLEDNGATLKVRTGEDRSLFYAYITLRYYKTTDTPGSGMWGVQGSLYKVLKIASYTLTPSLVQSQKNLVKTFTVPYVGYYNISTFESYKRSQNRSLLYLDITEGKGYSIDADGSSYQDLRYDANGWSFFVRTIPIYISDITAEIQISLWGNGYSPDSIKIVVNKIG